MKQKEKTKEIASQYEIIKTKTFLKDLKSYQHKSKIMAMVEDSIKRLKDRYRMRKEHELHGRHKGINECHLRYDLLLTWIVNSNQIKLLRLGTHQQLFN